jgi:type II secretory pathway pseudopilin PulG
MQRRHSRRGEHGYALMILLLTMALMAIFAGIIIPSITFEIKHDREEEMIHRGVQYSRAIRKYYKKFGRYPVKLEDLESTNNMRFLRKRYKDPTNCANGTCQDFKLLHFGEVKLTFGGGMIPGATQVGAPGASLGSSGMVAAPNTFGANSLGGGGTTGDSSFGQTANPATPPAGSDPSQASSNSDQNSSSQNGDSGDQSSSSNSSNQPGQQFGGGPIVGVVSLNKKEGYREFNHKKKYNEWQFIYDPGTDLGGLLMTPNQPPLFNPQQMQNTQSGSNPVTGQPGTPLTGTPTNAPTPPQPGPSEAPSDSNNPPQQQ